MSDQQVPGAEAHTGPVTKESLFPDGLPGTPERKAFLAQSGLEAAGEPEGEAPAAELEEENLAEAQVDEGEVEEVETVQEAALGRMRLNDFLDAAGVSMEEFYRDVVVERDGAEVSVSKAWDDYKAQVQANEALLRERAELQEKANRAATSVPQPGISPDAQALAFQAQEKMRLISESDWSQMDAGHAANFKLDLRSQADQLWQQAQAKQAEHQGKVQTEMRNALEEADRQTRAQIPEWNDQSVRTSEVKAIKDHLSKYGISEQEADSVIDPRWRRVLRDAQKASADVTRVQKGAKTIRKVGRTVAPGARAGTPKMPTLQGARAALKKAKEGGANKDQLARERLAVTLPDIKPAKRVR